MCRVANPAGIELEVYKGALNRPLRFSFLPSRVDGVPGWEDFVVRSNFPDAPARILPAASRQADNTFADGSGFLRLGLKGGKLQAYFRRDGKVRADYVAQAVEEVSKLAANVDLG
jgi:hypothetical protein